MSKLLEDPKVQALVDKQVAKAKKEAVKAAIDVLKSAAEQNKGTDNREVKKAVAEVLKSSIGEIKQVA